MSIFDHLGERKEGWWLTMDEPLVYYCADLFEQYLEEKDPRAGARILGGEIFWILTCVHGATVGYIGNVMPSEIVRKHIEQWKCACAQFLVGYLHRTQEEQEQMYAHYGELAMTTWRQDW